MPLKVEIHLGSDTFQAEGDFTFDAGFAATFRQWINVISPVPNQIETLGQRVQAAVDKLKQTITENTPTP